MRSLDVVDREIDAFRLRRVERDENEESPPEPYGRHLDGYPPCLTAPEKGVPVGRYSIRVSYIGYEMLIVPEIQVGSAREVVLSFELKEALKNIYEVVVRPYDKGTPKNDMAIVSARSFSVEESQRIAGSAGDPGRMALSFAGVNTDVAKILIRFVRDRSNLQTSTVIGSNIQTAPELAALVNGTLAHALDYDDATYAVMGHLSAVLVPALLAVGESRACPGRSRARRPPIRHFSTGFRTTSSPRGNTREPSMRSKRTSAITAASRCANSCRGERRHVGMP